MTEVMIYYSTLQAISHRAGDSWVFTEEGTTAHISRQHTQDYARLSGQIVGLLHDVVLSELDKDGIVCGCRCPACSVGICVCGLSSRGILREAQSEAQPAVAEHGVPLAPPRPESAAARASFQHGDVIVLIDDAELRALPDLQRTIRDHAPGDRMPLKVRRKAGLGTVFVEHRQEGVAIRDGVDPTDDRCVAPSGPEFHRDQATQALADLQSRKSANDGGKALASLTPREVQVLRLVGRGETNPEIAEELEIRRPTVARHIANILRKLELANRAQAAALAGREGLLR